MAKIFEVEIQSITTGVMYVQANDEREAIKMADELVEENEGEWHPDWGGGYSKCVNPVELIGKAALENRIEGKN